MKEKSFLFSVIPALALFVSRIAANSQSVYFTVPTVGSQVGSVSSTDVVTGATSVVVPNLARPTGLAFDPSWNLYFGSYTSGYNIFKLPPGGSPHSFGPVPVIPSIAGQIVTHYAFSIALNAVNDVYYTTPTFSGTNGQPGTVSKIDHVTGLSSVVVSNLTSPSGLAFDCSGNLYYGNYNGGFTLFELSPNGTLKNYGMITPAQLFLSRYVFSLAINNVGDVFYTTPTVSASGTISKIDHATHLPSIVVSNLTSPSGLAFDPAGNLYFGDYASGWTLFKYPPGGPAQNMGIVAPSPSGPTPYVFTLAAPLTNVINGHVYCACDSNAISGALVQIGSYSARTDTNGVYTLTNVPPGTDTVVISATNYASLTTNLTLAPCVPATTNDFYLTNLTFVINPIFDLSITTNANALAITNSIKSAIQVYEQYIANPLCVKILFAKIDGTGFDAKSTTFTNWLPYSTYLADLQANANKSPNDISALATMPGGPGTGINGITLLILSVANLAAIGETAKAAEQLNLNGGFYGYIYLNLSQLNYSRPDQDSTKFDLQTAAEHEIDEVLGIGINGSWLQLTAPYAVQPSPTDYVCPLDLFRYSAPGVRSFTLDPAAKAYFSIDGGRTTNVYFNQSGFQSGNVRDFGDWVDNNPPQVQDFTATPGTNANLGANELIALDVIGYNLLSAPPVIQKMTYTANSLTFGWAALPGQSYQVQYTTNLTGNSWKNLGDPITAGNLTAAFSDTNASDPKRFYRVVALH